MWEKIKSWFGLLDLNKNGKVTAEDLELAKAIVDKKAKDANETINEAVEEFKARVESVKEEVADIKIAVEETINQVGDIAKAASGKKRSGRKKKAKND